MSSRVWPGLLQETVESPDTAAKAVTMLRGKLAKLKLRLAGAGPYNMDSSPI